MFMLKKIKIKIFKTFWIVKVLKAREMFVATMQNDFVTLATLHF